MGMRHWQSFLATALLSLPAICCLTPAHAQTETVLFNFGHKGYGHNPFGRLLLDHAGNLFGTNALGGARIRDRFGTVFELKPNGQVWQPVSISTFTLLNGGFPVAGIIRDSDGSIFGTGELGGSGCGIVYEVTRQSGAWSQNILHTFSAGDDGCVPNGELVRDSAGNLYGVTGIGGAKLEGTVFKLAKSGNAWTETILYDFDGGADGEHPQGMHMAADGTIFGTTNLGGAYGGGTVFQLVRNGGVWSETTLYSFGGSNDGTGNPTGGLVEDSGGNLYGSDTNGGPHGFGSVFELSPSQGGWTETALYGFTGGADGNRPVDGITLASGSLYGVTSGGGAFGGGTVFKLTQAQSAWSETVLHSFPSSGTSDGNLPDARPILDKDGTLYGTTSEGGTLGGGVAYEISP
jgi:uncharacterized repeat protein (TIGR03803 family)